MDTTTTATPKRRPAYHSRETADGWELRVEVPGCDEQAVELTVDEGYLRLRATAAWPEPEEDTRVVLQEFGPRTYGRAFLLPEDVDPAGIEARVADGVLRVKLPRRERSVRSIPIRTA